MINLKPNLWNTLNTSQRHYEINGKTLREEKLISEGAFAFVYLVRDIYNSETYALKKIRCQEKERKLLAYHEIEILKNTPPHPNLIRYYGNVVVKYDHIEEVLILMELCEGGHLLNFLDHNNGIIKESLIITILKEIVSGVEHMHTLPSPIAHRDLKVENILFSQNGQVKICDFGSTSSHFIDTMTCSKEELLKETSSIEQYTTMIYRAPEMIDLHRQYKITVNVDIWMIGCILFILAFYKHPFQESGPLAIANAKFDIPVKHRFSRKLTDLIIWMLSIEPGDRPSSTSLLEILSNYSELESIPMPKHIQEKCNEYYEAAQKKHEMMNTPYKPLDITKIPKHKKKSKVPAKPIKLPHPGKHTSHSGSNTNPWSVFDPSAPDITDMKQLFSETSPYKDTNNVENSDKKEWDPFTNPFNNEHSHEPAATPDWDPFHKSLPTIITPAINIDPFEALSVSSSKDPDIKSNLQIDFQSISNKSKDSNPLGKYSPLEDSLSPISAQSPTSNYSKFFDSFSGLNQDFSSEDNRTSIKDFMSPTNSGSDPYEIINLIDDGHTFLSKKTPLLYEETSAPSPKSTSQDSTNDLAKSPNNSQKASKDSNPFFNLDDSIGMLINEAFNDMNINLQSSKQK